MAGKRDAGEEEGEEEMDHYAVLGLPSGEEGAALTLKQIEKAYKAQSRARHPDKRPDDPNATADFQRLKSSFELLRDQPSRAAFDARLRARADAARRLSLRDAKRRRAASDLEERERAAAREDLDRAEETREKRVAAELQRELADFQARVAKKPAAAPPPTMSGRAKGEENGKMGGDEERTLKVSWDREGGDYTYERLKGLFERFGQVEDLVIGDPKKKRNKGSALVIMSTKDAVIAATRALSGDIGNPLLVLPFQAAHSSTSNASADSVGPKLRKVVGAGFHDYEASIMEKLKKAKDK